MSYVTELTLQQRIQRMQVCAKKLNALYFKLSALGIGNIPFNDDEPIDTYDKDAEQGLDILCAITKAEKIAIERANELANQIKEAEKP